MASWGEGSPIIGILGEYDALPSLSQDATPERNELVPGGPGHGCGHNLYGVGALGAALAMQQAMQEQGITRHGALLRLPGRGDADRQDLHGPRWRLR